MAILGSKIGKPASLSKVFITENNLLDLKTGMISPIEDAIQDKEVQRQIEVVHQSIDEQVIEFKMVNSSGEFISEDGYLVEIYLSNSSGLTKVYKDDIYNETTDDLILEGFGKYFDLEIE